MEELEYELEIDLDKDSRQDMGLCKSVEGIASIITRSNYFARDIGQHLYYYKNGVYKANAETAIELAVTQILDVWKFEKGWSTHKINQVFNYIRIKSPNLLEVPEINKINLRNGIFNLEKMELIPHTHEYRTSVQLNIWYDKNAKCPAWDKFISEVFSETEKQLGYDIPAWLMVPFTSSNKCVVLEGSGSNGKSIYLHGLRQFIGESNICNVPLQRLSDRFTTTLLVGKLANISPDLPNSKIQSTGEFKNLTGGGDTIQAEYKHGKQFDFVPFARCVFACNEMPSTPDVSDGFYRRLNIIKFERQFKEDPLMAMKLKEALGSSQEISGLFNKCVAMLPRILIYGMTITDKMREALEDHRKDNDPVARWLEDTVTFRPDEWIEKKELFKMYRDSGNKGTASRSQVWFGRAVMKYVDGVVVKQVRDADRLVSVYFNIALKTDLDREGILEIDLENSPDEDIEEAFPDELIITDEINFSE